MCSIGFKNFAGKSFRPYGTQIITIYLLFRSLKHYDFLRPTYKLSVKDTFNIDYFLPKNKYQMFYKRLLEKRDIHYTLLPYKYKGMRPGKHFLFLMFCCYVLFMFYVISNIQFIPFVSVPSALKKNGIMASRAVMKCGSIFIRCSQYERESFKFPFI